MDGRFRHSGHVFRVGALFAAGFLFFLGIRAVAMPNDFGTLGFYRAGALPEIAALPIRYAGEAACVECHTVAADDRKPGKHAQVRCEACHGPQASHASGVVESPPRPDPKTLCVGCHRAMPGKGAWFPVIDPADHYVDKLCTECHKPHHPGSGG